MKINIISHFNGVGLSQDVELLTSLLDHHDVKFVELGDHDRYVQPVRKCRNADINIFVELHSYYLNRFAKINIFIPNPEWFWEKKFLHYIDIVIAKTRDSERIFTKLGCKNVVYTSFTSKDKKIKNIAKQNVFTHFAGKSSHKGTMSVHGCWKQHPELPPLIFGIYENNRMYYHTDQANIWKCLTRLSGNEHKTIQNKALFHICTSEYEGFGHYIWEGMSCGAIIITTDAEPMNSFINGNGFLVRPYKRTRRNMGVLSKIRPVDLYKVIQQTQDLSTEEKLAMSLQSRKLFEDNDSYFRKTFVKLIDSL